MDVVVWLRGLGLGRYEAAFRDNEINERVLQSLTQKELGVAALGACADAGPARNTSLPLF
jgi:SAM domain (Sterile alpha motif)